MNSRTPPTCDISLDSLTLSVIETEDFVELLLLYRSTSRGHINTQHSSAPELQSG